MVTQRFLCSPICKSDARYLRLFLAGVVWLAFGCVGCKVGVATDKGADDDSGDDDDNSDDDDSGDDDDNDADDDDDDDSGGDADGDGDGDADGDGDGDADGDGDGDADGDGDGDADADSDGDADSDLDSDSDSDGDTDVIEACTILGEIQDSIPMAQGTITIGNENHSFNPDEITSVRPDVFRPGFFSVFDILVHLADNGKIELSYEYDEDMETHVITDLNGSAEWWYVICYHRGDGFKYEQKPYRMDTIAYKDGATVQMETVDQNTLDRFYEDFKTQVARRKQNGGKVILSAVDINLQNSNDTFTDIEVTPHNLRHDMFKPDVITAVDILMSLQEKGLVTCTVAFTLESATNGSIIKDFLIDEVNGEEASGSCGIFYQVGEVGNAQLRHVNPDILAIHSPDYARFIWGELGPC